MGRAPCCDKAKVKKGPWSPQEDAKLKAHIQNHGTGGNWITLPNKIGLKRCGKSCRLRWLNYLRPNLKHGGFTADEDNLICSLYFSIGSRWSVIAAQLPGRTDNDIKNYWNTRLKKKLLGKQNRSDHHHPRAAAAEIGPAPPPPSHAPDMPQLEESFWYFKDSEANFQCAQHDQNVWDNSSINLLPSQVGVPQLHTAAITSSSSIENVRWEDMNHLSYPHTNTNYQPWVLFDEPSLLGFPQ